MLIVIEGLDGSGKATQTDNAAQWLRGRGTPVTQVTFPDYASRSSELVKMYLDGEIGAADDVNAWAATTFYAADRYVSYQNHWKKALQSGHTIVSDRYTTSNAAHQMPKLPQAEWDGYLAWLEDYEYAKLGLPRPDLVLYLDMHPDTSRKLIRRRCETGGHPMDIHERDLAYLMKCRQAALYAADKLGWTVLRCCDGAEPYPIPAVFEEIKRVISAHLI